MRCLLPTVSCWVGLFIASSGLGQRPPVTEASGITRHGDTLLIVDDGYRGVYFRVHLENDTGPIIRLAEKRIETVSLPHAALATDLESIALLGDGRVAVLSERLRALFGAEGVIAEYGSPMAEFGKRGLEGLAVRPQKDGSSKIAVLWEGGYPEYEQVPEQLRGRTGRLPMRPKVQVHTLERGALDILVRGPKSTELEVPSPRGRPPRAQRFRAPDLVWHQGPGGCWGFIVLLSSHNSLGKREYRHHWLQRFSARGSRIGEPIDLDRMMPEDLKGVNWEGLGWFEKGKSLVIVHESHPVPNAVAYVVQLPPQWRPLSPGQTTFTHWLKRETDYYVEGPDKKSPADGSLAAGTKVTMLERDGKYCLVRTDENLTVYIAQKRLKPYQPD